MANAEQEMMSQNSWVHAVERVRKTGYADGASEGQDAAFQTSFDMGYQQGIDFGLKLGLKQAWESSLKPSGTREQLIDRRKINCQICINGTTNLENIGNLYNLQQEKNAELLQNYR